MDVIIFYVFMVLGATYLDEGGPNKDSYACPSYCAVNHKHLAFKDTTDVYSNMAENRNRGFLGGLFDLIGGKQGTEVDALPLGDASVDNLKEKQRRIDTHQEQIKQQMLARQAALHDMKMENMQTEMLLDSVMPDSDKAFETMPPDKTKADKEDALVKEATQNIGRLPGQDYQDMLAYTSSRYGMDNKQLSEVMDRIGYHESAGTLDPTIHQYGGGPGRGIFQFEQTYKNPKTGAYEQAGAMTARNRLEQFYADELGMNAPEWLTQKDMNDPSVGFDVSQLTPEQQKLLFMANVRYHPKASLKGVTPENVGEQFWAPYHWAGADEHKEGHLKSFAESMKAYDKKHKKP